MQNLNISSNEIKVFTVAEWGTISNHDIIVYSLVLYVCDFWRAGGLSLLSGWSFVLPFSFSCLIVIVVGIAIIQADQFPQWK